MIRRIGLFVALSAAGLGIATPSYASAATTIGSNLSGSPTSALGCGGGCTVTFSTPVLAPSDGVVVRWRVKVGNVSSPAALRIVRPGNSSTATGAGTGPTENPPANMTSTYDVRLPIQAGDGIGLNCCSDFSNPAKFFAQTSSTRLWNPPLVDGEPPRPPGNFSPAEPLLNADIEADADHDGFGDETQDQCPTNATTQGLCPVPLAAPAVTGQRAAALKRCKKKAKKKDWTKKRLRKCKKKARLLPV